MMTSLGFVFFLTCLFLGQKMVHMTDLKFSSSLRQDKGFVSVNAGDNLTLRCFYEGDVAARFYWYKQTLGQKPRVISTYHKYERNGTFHDELKNNPRFALDTEIGKNHLEIKGLRISDSATYYCISGYSYVYDFLESIIVNVKGSGLKIQASVHQSASESIQPGDSVTLNCTVHTGTCDDGKHSVYWFKKSQESNPVIIYTHGVRNDQCERNNNTQTHTCVYNLPMKSLNLSHVGTYYCAVASCGQILFGHGTKIDFEHVVESLVLVYLLSGALTFTTVLVVLLAFSVCVIYKRCQRKESHVRFSASSMSDTEGHQNEENITYAALKEHKVNRSRKQRNNTETECVYSSVKQ